MAEGRHERAHVRTTGRRASVCEGCGTRLNAYNPLRWCQVCVKKRHEALAGGLGTIRKGTGHG